MIERAFVERFAAANALVDLTPYLTKAGLSKDMFVKGLMGYSEYNNDGKLVSVPFNRSTPILYYNKTAYKEVGLNPDKGPENWAQLKEYAEKAHEKRRQNCPIRIDLADRNLVFQGHGGAAWRQDHQREEDGCRVCRQRWSGCAHILGRPENSGCLRWHRPRMDPRSLASPLSTANQLCSWSRLPSWGPS